MSSERERLIKLSALGMDDDADMQVAVNFADEVDDDNNADDDDDGSASFSQMKPHHRFEARAAERLSVRLLAVEDDDSDEEERILRESLQLGPSRRVSSAQFVPPPSQLAALRSSTSLASLSTRRTLSSGKLDALLFLEEGQTEQKAERGFQFMVVGALAAVAVVSLSLYLGVRVVGPPSQPVGPYMLVERQEGDAFFDYYTFYEGRDSVGSNGFNMYVGLATAEDLGIVNVTREFDVLDVYATRQRRRRRRQLQWRRQQQQQQQQDEQQQQPQSLPDDTASTSNETLTPEPFVYMGSSSTPHGPRNSIRLEGIRRFNRGLFVIDVRHMPAGCGVWPAFWLTDEANWPVNGEIDIVEGVNYQSEAKTALHSTDGCAMTDIPLGTMTGTWDTAQGIPDSKTGIPDMTLRYANNCFVYDPHQWLNQGCVAVDSKGDSLGEPLNANGGGVFALEWDPINRHIRSWVFTPHTNVPDNLVDAIRTASKAEEDRVMPDPDLWPIPYGYYAIGDGTDCPSNHFRQMRLVLNTAFCGSVAGNRFQLDCPEQAKTFDTCNDWIKSEPEELTEAYWKIRGVYVFERQWERTWMA